MALSHQYADEMKFAARGAWLASLLAAFHGFEFLKKNIFFVPAKLYRFPIETAPLKSNYRNKRYHHNGEKK